MECPLFFNHPTGGFLYLGLPRVHSNSFPEHQPVFGQRPRNGHSGRNILLPLSSFLSYSPPPPPLPPVPPGQRPSLRPSPSRRSPPSRRRRGGRPRSLADSRAPGPSCPAPRLARGKRAFNAKAREEGFPGVKRHGAKQTKHCGVGVSFGDRTLLKRCPGKNEHPHIVWDTYGSHNLLWVPLKAGVGWPNPTHTKSINSATGEDLGVPLWSVHAKE